MRSWANVLGGYVRRLRWLPLVCLAAACLLTTLSYQHCCALAPTDIRWEHDDLDTSPADNSPSVTIVVASQLGDDVGWLDEFAGPEKLVYVTNDPSADLSVPKNKGREGMVYLTYIIENYDRLADTIIFSHSARYQWHNDDLFYDGEAVLSRLNFSYVNEEGYTNLRCCWKLGCPAEIRPLEEALAPPPTSDPKSDEARAGAFFKEAFEELFPDVPVPEVVGAHCCAQFAVTADRIRQRPAADYQRYRDWLLRTPLRDSLSGRILEYLWHIIFNKPPVHCPDAGSCYCRLFGLCGLQCESEGVCSAAYTLPPYSTLPEGWPDLDWEKKWRNVTELRELFEIENSRAPEQIRRQS